MVPAKVNFLQIPAASMSDPTWITDPPSRGRVGEIPRVGTKKLKRVFKVPWKAGDVGQLGAAVVHCGVDHRPALSSHKWAQE